MKLILHQRYRHLLTGRTATLLDIADDHALLHDHTADRLRVVPLWMMRIFWIVAATEAAA